MNRFWCNSIFTRFCLTIKNNLLLVWLNQNWCQNVSTSFSWLITTSYKQIIAHNVSSHVFKQIRKMPSNPKVEGPVGLSCGNRLKLAIKNMIDLKTQNID